MTGGLGGKIMFFVGNGSLLLLMCWLCQAVNQHIQTNKVSFPRSLIGNPGARGLFISHFYIITVLTRSFFYCVISR